MSVSALSAAKTLCELRDWKISNLELQKLLYIAQMLHLGRHGTPLISERFEAWDYGPVVPDVYRRAKGFGSSPVRNVFHHIDSVPDGTTEMWALKEAVRMTRGMTPGRLVSITHWPEGAWYKVYRPNKLGLGIPNGMISAEYDRRRATSS